MSPALMRPRIPSVTTDTEMEQRDTAHLQHGIHSACRESKLIAEPGRVTPVKTTSRD